MTASAQVIPQIGADLARDAFATLSSQQPINVQSMNQQLVQSMNQQLLSLLDVNVQARPQQPLRSLSKKSNLQRLILLLALGTSPKMMLQRLRRYMDDAFGKTPYVRVAFLACAAFVGSILCKSLRGRQLYASMAAARGLKGGKGEDGMEDGKHVCVIGGGIAGCGAAWALQRSGFKVSLLEKKPALGGNNKAHTWKVGSKDVHTSVGVLAWPKELFHNYNLLLQNLKVAVKPHQLRWFITRRLAGCDTNDVECVYAQGESKTAKESLQQPWLVADLTAYNRMVAFVRRCNLFFQPPPLKGVPCMYRNSLLNPMNLISCRRLSRFFGVSDRFWNEIFIAVHASTFLETKFHDLPAVVLEIIEDVVPIGTPKAPIVMDSWADGNAVAVYDRMTEGVDVHTSTGVEALRFQTDPKSGAQQVTVMDDSGVERLFDKVVFACGAPATLNALPSQRPTTASRFVYWLLRKVLSNCRYVESRDKSYERGILHSDSKRGLPTAFEKEILADYGTYCESQYDSNGVSRYENVFVLSSWIPPMQEPDTKGKRPMLVSWNCKDRLEDIADEDNEGAIIYREAHPLLNQTNMMASMFLYRHFQGCCGDSIYFCGSSVTPGNGHDLSLLSGFVVARALGADYPFSHDEAALADFHTLQDMMGLRK